MRERQTRARRAAAPILLAAVALLPAAAAADEPAARDATGAAPAGGSVPPPAAVEGDRFESNPPWVLAEKRVRLDREDTNVVRLGPGERYAVLGLVPKGSTFLVLAKKDDWYNVRLSETQTGWVHESLCREYDDMSALEFRPNPRLFSRIGSFTLTTYGGGYSFDRKSNGFALGTRLGYYVFDFVEVEGGVSWTHVERPAEIVESLFDLSLEAEKFHMLFYEMNVNAKILPGRQLVPYATVGVGSSILRGKTEPSFNYGGGIHFFVTKKSALRWEFRTYQFDSGSENARRSNTNFMFTLGTTFLL